MNKNLTDIISEQANLQAQAIAVYHGEETVSYEKLDTLIWQVSDCLYKNGVRSKDVVAQYFTNEFELLVSILATARLGATVFSVPVSTPEIKRKMMLSKVKTDYVSTNLEDIDSLESTKVIINSKQFSKELKDIDKTIKDDNPISPWLIISGSGTTGNSKLIPVTHAQFIHRIKVYDDLFDISVEDRITSLINLDFATPKHQLLHALFNGASVVFFNKPVLHKIETIVQQKVTVIYSVVTHLEHMMNRLPSDSKKVLQSLKLLVTSGSTATERLRKKVWEKLTSNLCVAYGTNECWLLSNVKQDSALNAMKSVGKPCVGVDIDIIDAKGNTVASGEVGEVRIKSHGMANSYLDDKDATKIAFKDGWFYPGDLGKFSENGELLHWGRADHMMIMDGINIYPTEIESVMTQHPFVIDAAVLPIKHQAHQDVPVCTVVVDNKIYKKQLMDFAYQRLGSSGPREMLIVEQIPRNEQGKLIRSELSQIILEKLTLKQEQSKETILVMFSGGIDSTYMLYHYLVNTDYKVHVHHISLRYPSEPRWEEEDISSRRIVDICRKIRPFDYSDSRVDIGFYKYVGRDSDTQLLMASKVAPNIKGKVSVALGWQYADYQEDLLNGRAQNRVSEKLWEALCESMDGAFSKNVNKELLLPLVEMKLSKKEMIKTLPKDILRRTWSCRRPEKGEDGVSKTCGKCHPCKDIKEALVGSSIKVFNA